MRLASGLRLAFPGIVGIILAPVGAPFWHHFGDFLVSGAMVAFMVPFWLAFGSILDNFGPFLLPFGLRFGSLFH